jgi:hypothetical protein
MANPNIVNVVSIVGGNAAWALTTGVTTTLLTVGADVLVKINSIIATNTHATNATALTLDINGLGAGAAGVSLTGQAAVCKLASTVNIPADDILVVIDKPIYLMENDILRGGASVATCDLLVSYEVINDA